MSADSNPVRLKFPLWAYLTQPVFSPDFKSLNPFRFWHLHTIEQLNTTWEKSEPPPPHETIHFLEDCWLQTDAQSESVWDDQFIDFLETCWLRDTDEWQPFWDWSEECNESEESY